jgi:hypothetical protein
MRGCARATGRRLACFVRAQVNLRWNAIAATLVIAPLLGCVGTVDSLHMVQGEAPATGGCAVVISKAGTADVIAKESVRGSFSVMYAASGPIAPSVDISAECFGATVKELKAVSPRSMGNVQLGNLAP